MKATLATSLLAAAFLAACTTELPPSRAPASATLLQAQTRTACPLGVPGAHVVVDDTNAGATLTFTATSEHLEDLRERARNASALHGPDQRVGKGHDGKHGMGGDHGIKAMQLPPTYAGEEDIEGGARIRFTAVDPNDLGTLRAKLRERARAMMTDCTEEPASK